MVQSMAWSIMTQATKQKERFVDEIGENNLRLFLPNKIIPSHLLIKIFDHILTNFIFELVPDNW
jgi:hypothetical protein